MRVPVCSIALIFLSLPSVCAQVTAEKTAAPSNPRQASTAATSSENRAHLLDTADLEAFFDGIFPIQFERSDIAGATVLVMKEGHTLLQKGYGYSDWEKKVSVDPVTTAFRLASISKLFTWVSVMQLVEQNKLNLDADVNSYLDFQIRPAFGKPVTLRNLMTHTGGFEEVGRDLLFIDPKNKVALRQFLIDNQPNRLFPPGTVPAYSNYGVGLAGYIVEHVSQQPFEQYVREHIFLPLAMTHSTFDQPAPGEIVPSQGYRATDKSPVGFEIFLPPPAGGVSSSASDMGHFGQALLNGGELGGKRILKSETIAAMWTPQFRVSEALPAACMGFYETWRNGLRFIGHDGDLRAFHSMFLIEPKQKLVLFASYNSAGSGGQVRSEILRSFADRYYPTADQPSYLTTSREQSSEYAGTYVITRRADSTKLALANLALQGTVSIDKDGVLSIDVVKDVHGHVAKWKPVGKDLWRQVDDQHSIFFIRDGHGQIVRAAIDFPGIQVERVGWWGNGKVIVGFAAASLVVLLAVVLASVIRFLRRLLFRRRPRFQPQPGTLWLTAGPQMAAWAWLVVAGFAGGILSYFIREESTLGPTHAFDKYFVIENAFSAVALFFSLWTVVSGVRIWFRDVRLITRVKFSLVALACIFLSLFAIHSNVIGSAHRY